MIRPLFFVALNFILCSIKFFLEMLKMLVFLFALMVPLSSADAHLEVHMALSSWCKIQLKFAIRDIIKRIKNIIPENFKLEKDEQIHQNFKHLHDKLSRLESSDFIQVMNCELPSLHSVLLEFPVPNDPGFHLLSLQYLQLKAISEVYEAQVSYSKDYSAFEKVFEALENDYSKLIRAFFRPDEFPSALKISSWNTRFFTYKEGVVKQALETVFEIKKNSIKQLKEKILEFHEKLANKYLNYAENLKLGPTDGDFFQTWEGYIDGQQKVFMSDVDPFMEKRYFKIKKIWNHIWCLHLARLKTRDKVISHILQKLENSNYKELWHFAEELGNFLDTLTEILKTRSNLSTNIAYQKILVSENSPNELQDLFQKLTYMLKIVESASVNAKFQKHLHCVELVEVKIMLIYSTHCMNFLNDDPETLKNYNAEKINQDLIVSWKEIIDKLKSKTQNTISNNHDDFGNFPDIKNIRILISIILTQKNEFEFSSRRKLQRFQYCPFIQKQLPMDQQLKHGRDIIAIYINFKITPGGSKHPLNTKNLKIIHDVLTEYFGIKNTPEYFEYPHAWDRENFDFGCDEVVAGILEVLLDYCKEFVLSDQNNLNHRWLFNINEQMTQNNVYELRIGSQSQRKKHRRA